MPESEISKALTARAGDHWCALPLPRVRRVIHALALHPLPGASTEIAGLAEVDGEPLVVLSLERLIGAPPGPAAEFPVTLLVEAGPEHEREIVGLAADEAGDIIRVDEAAIVGPSRGFVRGETRRDGGIVRMLDPSHLGKEDG